MLEEPELIFDVPLEQTAEAVGKWRPKTPMR
jgi:hypothetical protein